MALPPDAQSWQHIMFSQIVNGFWVTAVAAVASDLFGYYSGNVAESNAQITCRCGNFGIMLADACNQSVDIVKVLYSMSIVCMARGAQSGGIVVQGRTLSASQTGHSPREVEAGPAPEAEERQRWQLQPVSRPHGVFVTHNGDFECYELFGQKRTCAEVMAWLSAVLHVPPPADCDSVAIAGLIDLMRTQGLWLQSLRLAFQQCTGGAVQTKQAHRAVGDIERGVPDIEPPTPSQLQAGQDEAWVQWVAARDKWSSLCNIAMLNFVQNDLFWAVRQFLDNAHGSFGLAVMSEVDTGSLVLAAYKQPMTLTFAPHTGVVLYSSEAQATLQPLTTFASVPPQAIPNAQMFGRGKAESTDIGPPTYRIDMDDSSGEVYLLQYKSRAALIEQPCGAGIEPSMAVLGSIGSQDDSPPATADANAITVWPLFVDQTKMKADLGDSARFRTSKTDTNIAGCYGCQTQCPGSTPDSHLSLHVAMYNVAERRLIDRQDFVESRKLVSMQNNSYVPMQSNLPPRIAKRWKHQAERDLAEIPAVLGALAASWQDPKSFNCQSACELAKMLQVAISTSKHKPAWSARYAPAHGQAVDLVIVGVEASLWTAEQFAQDLKAVLPALQITVISSNKLVAMLEHSASVVSAADLSSGKLGISLDKQRTTVVCISHSGQTFPTIQAARWLSSNLPGRVFVMTGSIDTKMSLAVAQQTWKGAPFTRRIFVTEAGWRPAEPASLTAVATHHCLSELLMYIVTQLLGAQQPADSITEVLLSREGAEGLRMVQSGCLGKALPDLVGWNQDMEPVKSDIHTELGRWWALHVLEAWAWLLAAVYIAATVISTHPPFISIANATGVHGLRWLGHVLDSLVYMFSPVLCCFLMRILQGRPLLARLGRRTVLILDVPYVHQLLEAYVSKLLALSYGVASVDVHSADPTDHFVLCFTHRQAKAIRSLGCTAEAITVGHNPYSKASAMDRSIVLPTTRHRLYCQLGSHLYLQGPLWGQHHLSLGVWGWGSQPAHQLVVKQAGLRLRLIRSFATKHPLAPGGLTCRPRLLPMPASGQSVVESLQAIEARGIVHPPPDDGGTERTWSEPEQRPRQRAPKRSVHGKQSPQGASKTFWRQDDQP
ncbi:MAG: hypothetical protein FRX49_05671 [Trebouxia sp. A1-2]|nr:MAG: hypothetical protein FRX49_05671 [Trebouxia sp. A1-2]